MTSRVKSDDDEAAGASATKKARVQSNSIHDELSTSLILPPIQSVCSNLADMLTNSSEGEKDTENDSTNNNLMIWKLLINENNKENRLKLDDDPFLWWKNNIKYKAFSPIVRTYLSAPPSLVPREQLFSSAGLIYEPLRNRLEGKKTEKLFL
ncbi:hypothetical protein EVAR_102643_1 [Eumeta japonica]|uniref:HAT C-terminal dimerisation domain-containing protein n=1 Tax=Eumeta variegata TaxID=151549 RepID=A0A4C1TV70_EUMVA|nr:hypothetical protein EVAR_102643_1 [Eumeta japonica]